MRRVLLTGLSATNKKAADCLPEQSFQTIDFPLQEAVSLISEIPRMYDAEWTVFTSPAAVNFFFELKIHPPLGRVASLGSATTEMLRQYDVEVDLEPAKHFSSTDLLKEFKKRKIKTSSVLYPCSALADTKIEDGLRKLGFTVMRLNTYEPQATNKKELPVFDDIIFFSPSAAKVMLKNYGSSCLAEKNVVAIGERTANSLKRHLHINALVATDNTAAGCARLLQV